MKRMMYITNIMIPIISILQAQNINKLIFPIKLIFKIIIKLIINIILILLMIMILINFYSKILISKEAIIKIFLLILLLIRNIRNPISIKINNYNIKFINKIIKKLSIAKKVGNIKIKSPKIAFKHQNILLIEIKI